MQLMQRDTQRIAEPKGTPHTQRAMAPQKRIRHITTRGTVHDQAPQTDEEEGKERRVPPLPGRHPEVLAAEQHSHDPEIGGIKQVLATPTQHELAANRHHGSEHEQPDMVAAHQQAQGESRDQGTPGIIGREAPQPTAQRLREQGSAEEGERRAHGDGKIEPEHTVEQQGRQDRALIEPWIATVYGYVPGHKFLYVTCHLT